MSEKPIKINVPKDPIVIGKTAEGEPVWIEPKELIPTPAEDEERWSNTLDSRQQAMIDQAAQVVLRNASLFLEQTFLETAPKDILRNFCTTDESEMMKCLDYLGYSAIQDGLKTVVKLKGRILREMTANIEPLWRNHVARRVTELVAGKALSRQRN